MTEHEFKFSKCVEGFPEPKEQYPWDFLAVEEGMKGSGAKYDYLKRQLSVSDTLAFKIWKLSTPLKITSWVLMIAAIAFVIWACFHWGSKIVVPQITLWGIGAFIAGIAAIFAATYIVGKKVVRVVRLRETLTLITIGIVMSLLGWLVARLHLHIFDPMFLRQGSIETFKKIS
jgi:hypothetical protein